MRVAPCILGDGLAALFADAPRPYLLVGAHRNALMRDTGQLAALGAFDHHVRGVQRHRLLDDARLHDAPTALHVLLGDVQPLDDHLVLAGHRAQHLTLFATVLAREDTDGVAFMHVQLGQVQGFRLALLLCHCSLLLSPLSFGPIIPAIIPSNRRR